MELDLVELRYLANGGDGSCLELEDAIRALAAEVERLREDNKKLEDQTVCFARELTAIRDAGRGLW